MQDDQWLVVCGLYDCASCTLHVELSSRDAILSA